MEQNKTYIIILVVALSAAILIAAGLFLFSPRNDASAEQGTDDSFDPYVYIRKPAESEDQTINEIAGLLSTVDEPIQPDPDEPLIFRQQQIYGQQPQSPDTDRTQTDTQSAQPQTAPASQKTTVPEPTTPSPTTVAQRTVNQPATAISQPAAPSPATVAQRTVSQPATDSPQPRTITEYWIQLLASPSHQTAADAGNELRLKGISVKISSQRKNNTLYYRLRYGPFEVAEEAEKFLTWIQNLEKYEESYISREYHIQ